MFWKLNKIKYFCSDCVLFYFSFLKEVIVLDKETKHLNLSSVWLRKRTPIKSVRQIIGYGIVPISGMINSRTTHSIHSVYET